MTREAKMIEALFNAGQALNELDGDAHDSLYDIIELINRERSDLIESYPRAFSELCEIWRREAERRIGRCES